MTSSELTTPLTLRSGVVVPQRIAMAPMVAQGSDSATGHITEEDVAYFARRSTVAGMVITGAAYVIDHGRGFAHQISIADDSCTEGLARVASAIKADGAVAVVQLYHGGREASPVFESQGRVLGPSAQQFDWLPYPTEEMTQAEITDTITAFGEATRRAIEAGFDGVEIHGANHYLLQQFFSSFSNHRDDAWGGDLERRMAFPLAVTDEVMRVAATAGRPFAVGYRYCPDEVHGDTVGYDVDESNQLVEALVARGVDYIHVSLFTGNASAPTSGDTRPYGTITREVVDGRCPVIIVSNVFTLADAEAALEYGDIVAIGRAALMEPEFTGKIVAGKADDIATSVAGRFHDLDLPAGLIDWYLTTGRTLLPPLPGIEEYLPEA